jgi:hypothetical protein
LVQSVTCLNTGKVTSIVMDKERKTILAHNMGTSAMNVKRKKLSISKCLLLNKHILKPFHGMPHQTTASFLA